MRARILVFVLLLPVVGCQHRAALSTPAAPAQVPQTAPSAPPEEQQAPRRTRPLAPTPTPPVQQPQQPAEAPIRLGRALGPDEQRTLNKNIDQHLANAERLLSSLAGKRLNKQQNDSAAHVRGFIAQVAETRKTDLVAAKSLAERADVLASDLAGSVK